MIRVSKEPKENSAIYEIYNRLNTGGINLSPQEIRSSLFYSDYYDSLYKINKIPGWRRILNADEPGLHLKDVEILLRGFAILIDGDKYTPSLTRFLNQFSEKGKTFEATTINYLEQIFVSFINATTDLRENSFINVNNNNFNIALYEAVFNAVCKRYYKPDYSNINNINIPKISQIKLDEIANNKKFIELARVDSTSTLSIKGRLEIAYNIINS
jgi:hypothetical protein